MNLYSLRGSRPTKIPFRITLPNGFTRTDPSTFSEEELQAAGFTWPYTEPPYDQKTQVLDWNGTEYIIRPHNTQELDQQWKIIRQQRNQLLKDCDWTQIKDYNFNIENLSEWEIYRETLRNLPQEQSNPFDISWPELPSINS